MVDKYQIYLNDIISANFLTILTTFVTISRNYYNY